MCDVPQSRSTRIYSRLPVCKEGNPGNDATPGSLGDNDDLSNETIEQIAKKLKQSRVDSAHKAKALLNVLQTMGAIGHFEPTGILSLTASKAQFIFNITERNWHDAAKNLISIAKSSADIISKLRALNVLKGFGSFPWIVAVLQVEEMFYRWATLYENINQLKYDQVYITDLTGLLTAWTFRNSRLSPHNDLVKEAEIIRSGEHPDFPPSSFTDEVYEAWMSGLGDASQDAYDMFFKGKGELVSATAQKLYNPKEFWLGLVEMMGKDYKNSKWVIRFAKSWAVKA